MKNWDQLHDFVDAAAKAYGVKAIAVKEHPRKPEYKATSTLYGELNRQPNHKLGFGTGMRIIDITWDCGGEKALDYIESQFGRVALRIPERERGSIVPLLESLAQMTKEYGETLEQASRALADGRITPAEARACIKEIRDVIKACLRAQAYLEQYL